MVGFASGVDGATSQPPTELDRLGDEIAELAAHLNAATYRLLVRLREFDVREGWNGGFRSCARWLSWRTGIAPNAAREKVRVARALEQLPHISAAFERGQLSYAKVRAVTRVGTAETDAELLELALTATAAQVERIVRAWRRVRRADEIGFERERHESRDLNMYVDDDGSYILRARLDPEVGALLARALEAAAEALHPHPDGSTTVGQRHADALALIAELAFRAQTMRTEPVAENGVARPESPRPSTIGRAERFQVVVHVDEAALRADSDNGHSVLAGGGRVSAETSRRIACDATRVVMTHDADGKTVDVGRRTRTVPPSIRRALDHRDRHCQFPGCDNRFCDAHHIEHWADGGATRLNNLVLLCRRHHRAVHKDAAFRVAVDANGACMFYRRDGELLPHVPAAPSLPNDPVAELMNARRDVTAETTLPRWHGERLDLDFTVRALCGLASGV